MDMKLIETAANQLDLAAEFLSLRDSIRARLAMILTDNTVELLLHFEAEEALLHFPPSDANGPRFRCIRETLEIESGFGAKVKYALLEDFIDDDDALFLREAHKFRCDAYHTGRVHDDVLWELTHAYYDLACSILSRMHVRSFLSRFDQPFAQIYPTIAKYAGEEATPAGWVGLSSLSAALRAARPDAHRSLATAIRSLLLERIARIQEGVGRLFRAGGRGREFNCVNDFLFELQVWHKLYSYAPGGSFRITCAEDGTYEVDPAQKDEHREALEAMKHWRPPVTERTLAAWERQISQLSDRLPLGKMLQKYRTLSKKIVPFQTAVERQLGWLEIAQEAQRKS